MRVGSTYHDKGGTVITEITSIIIHKKFKRSTYDYDVALIKVRSQSRLIPYIYFSVLDARAKASLSDAQTFEDRAKYKNDRPSVFGEH